MSEHVYYMRVTPDEYELPMTPPLLASEMAALLGIEKRLLPAKAQHSKIKRQYKYKNTISIVRVDIDSDD